MKKDNNLIFDVGMHKGEDTLFYLSKGFNVVAFEADAELANSGRIKFKKEIAEGRLTIVEGAIVGDDLLDRPFVQFFKNKDVSVWGTVVEDWSKRNDKLGYGSEVIDVATVDFKKCLREYGIPYYLKVDIEGMDNVCLEALFAFDERPSYLSVEAEKVSFNRLKKDIDLLVKLGYDSFLEVNQSDIGQQKEPISKYEGTFVNATFEEGSSGLFGIDLGTDWHSSDRSIKNYWWIFIGYRLFGDNSKIKKWLVIRGLKVTLSKLLGRTVPGWYDTHARHSSIV